MYKEPYEVVRETFDSLSKSNYPLNKFIVVLTAEEREGAKEETQNTLQKI